MKGRKFEGLGLKSGFLYSLFEIHLPIYVKYSREWLDEEILKSGHPRISKVKNPISFFFSKILKHMLATDLNWFAPRVSVLGRAKIFRARPCHRSAGPQVRAVPGHPFHHGDVYPSLQHFNFNKPNPTVITPLPPTKVRNT